MNEVVTAGGTRIGFAGLGRMGLPVCAALVRAGYQVTAADERTGSRAGAQACGAVWQDTPAQAAAAAAVLITMLSGPGEVRAVMLGAAGALGALGTRIGLGTDWARTGHGSTGSTGEGCGHSARHTRAARVGVVSPAAHMQGNGWHGNRAQGDQRASRGLLS